jgi:hypothetical protein
VSNLTTIQPSPMTVLAGPCLMQTAWPSKRHPVSIGGTRPVAVSHIFDVNGRSVRASGHKGYAINYRRAKKQPLTDLAPV